MRDTLQQLLQPFNYLRIDHPHKRVIDWVVPLGMSVVLLVIIGFLKSQLNLYGSQGLIQTLTTFVQTLPGFYIAALAAIVTFSNEQMDALMPGSPPPLFSEKTLGKTNKIRLTRRRFLALMFAFLTAESIVIVALGIAMTFLAVPISNWNCIAEYLGLVSMIGVGLFLFLVMQMLVATFWGLFYLGSKLLSNAV